MKEDPVQALILFLLWANARWKTLEQWMSRCGLGNGPKPVIEKPAEHVASPLVNGAIRH